MKFCPICGARLEQAYDFCSYCGTKIERNSQSYVPSTQGAQPQGQAYGAPNYVYYPQSQPRAKYNLKNSIMSMAFGGAALEFSVMSFIPFFGLFMFLPAFITFCALSKKYARMHLEQGYPQNGFCKAGKILSTVAIPLGVVYGLYGLMFMLMFIIVIAASYGY